MINELPYNIRRLPENMILAGLWIGPKKTQMATFLQPFTTTLEKLENGIHVELDTNETVLSRCFLIAGTADLPAKCIVCNMTQYNGYYSCPSCNLGKQQNLGRVGHTYSHLISMVLLILKELILVL